MQLLTKLLYGIAKMSNYSFAIYYLYYKKIFRIIKYIYNFFLLWPSFQLLLKSDNLSDCINKFAIYHPHYKEKFNLTQIFAYATQPDLITIKKEILRAFSIYKTNI